MMNKSYKIPLRVLGYKLYRIIRWPKILPISLTLSVTNKCKSRCKTCNLWKTPTSGKELTVEEWKKVFRSLNEAPAWITFSGGNQFLRDDFCKIVQQAVDLTRPCLINIPLSTLETDKTLNQITKILEYSKTPVIINMSLDGTEKVHNFLRGRKDSFKKSIKIFNQLKSMKKEFPHLSVCFNTVVSEYNINTLDGLHELVLKSQPDYWSLEPFQHRAEFGNSSECSGFDNPGVFPKIKSRIIKEKDSNIPILRAKQIIRPTYYQLAEKTLKEKKQALHCYAAIASVQISPEGKVWQCGTKCDVLGDLRESDYDIKRIIFNKKADAIRKRIKEKKCRCIQCNAFYTNLLCNPMTLIKHSLKNLRRRV